MGKWVESEFGNYFSESITIEYLGDQIPKYHVLKLDGVWVIGVFYPLYDEYVPLDETDEQIEFNSHIEAIEYVENALERA